VITFLRTHSRAVKICFIAMLLVPVVAFIGNAISPELVPERFGCMLLFGSSPWALPFINVPFLGFVAVIIGFALNATIVFVACWRAGSWWLNTLRFQE